MMSKQEDFMMGKMRVKELLYYVGGSTKVIISDAFNPDNLFYEKWRGIVEDIDWDNVPYGDRYIEHVSVVNGEDWLQIVI